MRAARTKLTISPAQMAVLETKHAASGMAEQPLATWLVVHAVQAPVALVPGEREVVVSVGLLNMLETTRRAAIRDNERLRALLEER